MKRVKQILLIVGLLVMIPLFSISQKRYIIEGDTIICFTPAETRRIAIKFLEGEKYEKLYLNEKEISAAKDSVIFYKDYTISIRDSLLVVNANHLDEANQAIDDLKYNVEHERRAKRRNGWIAAGSFALNVLLIIFGSR